MNDFLKSKIVWVQLLAIAALVFEQFGMLGFMNPSIAAFITFSLTVILQKFASYKAIVKTYVNRDNTMFWINVVMALIMISDYFMQNKIFLSLGVNSAKIGMIVATINIILRTYFVNQPASAVKE